MRRFFISFFVLLGVSLHLSAQSTNDIMKEPIPVAMFQATYAFHFPGLDTKDLYGVSNNLGGGFVYKTESNWLFTANGNFIFSNRLNIDRVEIFGEGITTDVGEIIGGAGSYMTFEINQRGLHIQAEVGKLFPYGTNPNSGFFVQAGLGYLRNRIHVAYQQTMLNPSHQVEGDYEYGYDRMRGGPALHLETGYLYLSDTRLLNVSISFEVTYARTRSLRDYDFRVFTNPETEVMEPVGYIDQSKRFNDLYYGIRVTWNIPTYERQPQDYYYN